jgi:hypothetical protein
MVSGTFDEVNGPIVTNGLTVWLEAENPNSYPGTGSIWYDLSGNGNHGTLVNSPNWTTLNGVRTFSFNGSTQRVGFGYSTPVQTGSTGFTWNAWIYVGNQVDSYIIMGYRGTTLTFYKLTTNKFEMYPAEVYSPIVPLLKWTNITAVYNGAGGTTNNLVVYQNGLSSPDLTTITSPQYLRDADQPTLSASTMTFFVGGDPVGNEYLNGYISSVQVYNRALSKEEVVQNFNARRLLFGQAATSSTTTVGKISLNTNTVFASTFDEVSLNAGSVALNGSNQYLSVADNASFQFGTGDFTIECWCYPTFDVTSGSVAATLWSINGSSYALCCWDNIYKSWNFENTTNGYTVRPTGGIPQNQWTHVAYVRKGTTATVFYNGISVGTATDSQNYVATGGASLIGYRTSFVQPMIGNISDFRVTKGTALYTTNFTPPQSILDSTAATSVLLNVLTSSTFIKDNSVNNFTVTNINTATFSTNGPFNQGNFAVKQRQLFNGTLEVSGMFDETDTLTTIGGTAYVTTGTFTWTVPADVTSISVLAVGGGGSGGGYGGGGGALAYKNNVAVTPGQTYSLTVGWPNPYNSEGSATSSTFGLAVPLVANGGRGGNVNGFGGSGGIGQGFDGGGAGGAGGTDAFVAGVGYQSGGSGGAGGYTASGGAGATYPGTGSASTGGGGGGGGFPTTSTFTSKGGGGVGIYGLGANGAANGGGGSGGLSQSGNVGGKYGGGGPGISTPTGLGATGVVRIIWPGTTRRFPSTGDLTAINETTI